MGKKAVSLSAFHKVLSVQATNVSHLFVFLVIGTCYVIAAVYAAAYVKEPEQLLKCQMANNCVATDEKATEKRHWKCSQLFSLSHLSESFKVCFVDRSKEERVRLTVLFIMAMIVIIVTSGKDKENMYMTIVMCMLFWLHLSCPRPGYSSFGPTWTMDEGSSLCVLFTTDLFLHCLALSYMILSAAQVMPALFDSRVCSIPGGTLKFPLINA